MEYRKWKKKPSQTQLNSVPNLVPRYRRYSVRWQHPPSVSADGGCFVFDGETINMRIWFCAEALHIEKCEWNSYGWKCETSAQPTSEGDMNAKLKMEYGENRIIEHKPYDRNSNMYQKILLLPPTIVDRAIWKFMLSTSKYVAHFIPTMNIPIKKYAIKVFGANAYH